MGAGRPITRRDLIKRGGVLAGTGLVVPSILAACAPKKPAPAAGSSSAASQSPPEHRGHEIKVSTYGGFFEDNFKKMYPDFHQGDRCRGGVPAETTSEVWVVQLQTPSRRARRRPPTCRCSPGGVERAIDGGIIATYDLSADPNNEFLADGCIRRQLGWRRRGGTVSWYITLVSNTDRVPKSPDSSDGLLGSTVERSARIAKNAANSYLIEICATCYFDGYDILDTQDGVVQVLTKLQEVKPNVKLWYRDEATAQQAYNTGEVSLGQFYHDITTYAASQGEAIRSVFPTEGAILDSGFWSITKTTENLAACQAFVDYMCQPTVQAELRAHARYYPDGDQEGVDGSDGGGVRGGRRSRARGRPSAQVRDVRRLGRLDRPEVDRDDPVLSGVASVGARGGL